MADDRLMIEAPPSSVLAILSDPRRYEQFVVGNSGIRSFDPDWPAEGSHFHHTLGVKPFVVRDRSTCVGTDGRTYLSLLTRMGFVGATITTFNLHPTGDGTELSIQEEPLWGLVALSWSKLVDLVMAWRNRRLLVRVGHLAEEQFARERSTLPGQEPPAQQSPG